MSFHSRLVFGLLLTLFWMPCAAQAQDVNDGTLHVLRPFIHAEQEKAELCLEFDHPLVTDEQSRVTAAIKLESGLKATTLTPKNYSVSGSELCIPALTHRKDYRVMIANLRGAGGEKLANSYSFSFTVPARHPALVFINNANRDGLTRWQDNDPILRAVNVPSVKLELYRITDPAKMAEAWSQRMQTVLAPSESATFARTNGTAVWQDEVMLDDAPDKNIEQQIPLTANNKNLPQGLYLAIASAPELREAKSYLIPTAAAWLLRSDIKVRALRASNGFYALAEKADGSAVLKDIQFKILGAGQQGLAEGKSGDDGVALLPLPSDKHRDATVLAGLSLTGAADFFDLVQDYEGGPYGLPRIEANITPGKSYYVPTSMADILLTSRDIRNHPVSTKGSVLQLLRPDRSLYAEYPVADDPGGRAHVGFVVPGSNGVWPLVWKGADGGVLAESTLRVTSNPDAPQLGITADRALVATDGDVNVTLKSTTETGAAAPYIAGNIAVGWTAPDRIFPGWDDYHFGVVGAGDHAPIPEAFFVTDDKGIARVHMKLAPPEDQSPLHVAVLKVISDPATGAANPPDFTLPVRPKNFIVGIKPLASGARFTENSIARFDAVALDSEGKRSGVDDLSYQIYEEGRSFDWYQSEGRWEYKPLQQQRRIGGGPLTLTADGIGHIEWPALEGAYRLEVTNGNGDVLARMDFSAGWGFAKMTAPQPAGLDLKASPANLVAGQKTDIHFKLEKPAMITAVVADDHILSVTHTFKPQGDATISFVPAADWGNRVGVWISAEYPGNDGLVASATGHIVVSTAALADAANLTKEKKPLPHSSATAAPAKTADHSATTDVGLHTISEQTVAPQQQWIAPVEKNKPKPEPRVLFSGIEPLYALPRLLADALGRHPFTTAEIADQLEVLHLWHDAIIASGLQAEPVLRAQQDEWIARLTARQQSDGGFPSLPGGKSDFTGTSAALTALVHAPQQAATPVVAAAVDWLRHRLENNWFDEQERPIRPAAYAALAAAGKLDPSSLHYFADTSADKALPPLAAVQLASAFAALNDRDKATFWLGVAHLTKNASDTPANILPLLSANSYFDPHDVTAALAKISAEAVKKSADLPTLTSFLTTMWHVQDRAGAWRVSVNKNERTARGVAVYALPPGAASPVIRNLSEHPMQVVLAQPARSAPMKDVIERRVHRLNGEGAGDTLRQGETYVVTLEGPWPSAENAPVFVHDDTGPALRAAGCIPDAPDTEFLSWLRGLSLSSMQACEQSEGVSDFVVNRTQGGSSTWHVAYLAKADAAGIFDLPPPAARALFGNPDTLGGRKTRVRVN